MHLSVPDGVARSSKNIRRKINRHRGLRSEGLPDELYYLATLVPRTNVVALGC